MTSWKDLLKTQNMGAMVCVILAVFCVELALGRLPEKTPPAWALYTLAVSCIGLAIELIMLKVKDDD